MVAALARRSPRSGSAAAAAARAAGPRAGECGASRASRSFILPTELCRVATMSARNSGLSAWRSALRASSDSWLTRFLMSCRMKAKRRLNSSNRWALASASWPCASASELAAWRPAVRSRSKSSQSSGRRYSGAASSTRPTSRSWWISGTPAQASAVVEQPVRDRQRAVARARPAAAQRVELEDRGRSLSTALQKPARSTRRRPAGRAAGQFHAAGDGEPRRSSPTQQQPAGRVDDVGEGLDQRSPSGGASAPGAADVSVKRSHSVR